MLCTAVAPFGSPERRAQPQRDTVNNRASANLLGQPESLPYSVAGTVFVGWWTTSYAAPVMRANRATSVPSTANCPTNIA